jgi:fucose permease
MAGIAVLSALALAFSQRDEAPAARGLPDLRQRRLLVTLFILWNGLIEGATMGFGASALIGVDLSAPTAARLTSAFFLAYLLSRLSLYWLADRIAPGRLFLLGLTGAGAAMATAALGAPALGFVAAGAFIGVIFPAYYVWAIGILGEDGRMTAAILAMALLGGTLGPIALRPILAVTGEEGVFWIVSVVALTLAASFAALKERARALRPASA